MRYRFHDYELDEERHELRCAGEVVPLEPKVWRVLCYLLQQCDRVVSKTELLEACWLETFVTEAALTRCLTKLRQAIQPDHNGPRVVQTVHGQGYRLVVTVETLAPGPAPPSPPVSVVSSQALELPAPQHAETPLSLALTSSTVFPVNSELPFI